MAGTLVGALLLLMLRPGLGVPVPEDSKDMNEMSAMMYLDRYGYMDMAMRMMNMSANNYSHEVMGMAVQEFQSFMGLKVTGELDEETKTAMMTPRCGRKDTVGHAYGPRTKRYAHQGTRWRGNLLTYSVSRFTNRLRSDTVLSEMKRAADMWNSHGAIKFVQFHSKYDRRFADIDVRFVRGEHGDGDAFDGQGGTLAHATFPAAGGFVHFDDDEPWSHASARGRNFYQVALHEFGHTLGLHHSTVKEAIMYPTVGRNMPDVRLHQDDINGITALYGRRFGRLSVDSENTSASPPTRIDKGLCANPTPDTMFVTMEGELLAFKGDKYYAIAEDGGISMNYPKPINKTWTKLPSNIQAAFSFQDGGTYFLKGSHVWRYSGYNLDKGYPKLIKDVFPGVPSDVDAVMEWGINGHIYFFKGKKTWSLESLKSSSAISGSVLSWEGVPPDITAVFYYKGNTHFVKGSKYYLFDDGSFEVARADPPYPREVGSTWFGCPEKGDLGEQRSEAVSELYGAARLSIIISILVTLAY